MTRSWISLIQKTGWTKGQNLPGETQLCIRIACAHDYAMMNVFVMCTLKNHKTPCHDTWSTQQRNGDVHSFRVPTAFDQKRCEAQTYARSDRNIAATSAARKIRGKEKPDIVLRFTSFLFMRMKHAMKKKSSSENRSIRFHLIRHRDVWRNQKRWTIRLKFQRPVQKSEARTEPCSIRIA